MRSQEGQFSSELVQCLNATTSCYFRKASDRARVGLPDIIGCLGGGHVEIEVKHETVLDLSKKLPSKHTFTGPQRKEMTSMREAGAAVICVIACGDRGWAFPDYWLDDSGKVRLEDHSGDARLAAFKLPDIRALVSLIKSLLKKDF